MMKSDSVTPNIEMLNRRRRRKERLRHLRSLTCRLGIHDWVTREVNRGTTTVWSLFGGVQFDWQGEDMNDKGSIIIEDNQIRIGAFGEGLTQSAAEE